MNETTTEETNDEIITLAVVLHAVNNLRAEFAEHRAEFVASREEDRKFRQEILEKIAIIEQQIESIKLELFDFRVRFDEMTSSVHETLMVVYKDRSRQTLLETRLNFLSEQIEILRRQQNESAIS